MGFFSSKVTCGCCKKECGLNRYKIKKSEAWLCPECLKAAGGLSKVNVNTMTIEEIENIISEKKTSIAKRRSESSTGLSSAKDMYLFAKNNGYGSGFTDSWGVKHFKVIEDCLLSGENPIMTFIGLHNYISPTKHDGNFAYAITNKRIIMAQKQAVAGEKLQTVYLDNINDITFNSGLMLGVMTVDTIREVFNIGLDKVSAKSINSKVHMVLDNIRSQNEVSTTSTPQVSSADEIVKFKQLFDNGIITEEEFNAKKKQLLGL